MPATLAPPAADPAPRRLYGVLAEFDSGDRLREATERARVAGFTHLDAFSPVPVEGLPQALGRRKTRMPLVFLLGASRVDDCLRHAVVFRDGGLSVQRRRPSVPFLANVHPDHV